MPARQTTRQRLTQPAIVELYEMDLTEWSLGVVRVTNEKTAVTFGGVVYQPMPLQGSGFGATGRGAPQRPVVRLANLDGVVSGYLAATGGLVGVNVTVVRTYADNLDGQPGADPNDIDEPRLFVVRRVQAETEPLVELELGEPFDIAGRSELPGRRMLQAVCPRAYRRWTGAAFTPGQGDSCPYAGAAMFTRLGASTANPALDQCGKTLADCKLRYPLPQAAPFGGFPGLDRAPPGALS